MLSGTRFSPTLIKTRWAKRFPETSFRETSNGDETTGYRAMQFSEQLVAWPTSPTPSMHHRPRSTLPSGRSCSPPTRMTPLRLTGSLVAWPKPPPLMDRYTPYHRFCSHSHSTGWAPLCLHHREAVQEAEGRRPVLLHPPQGRLHTGSGFEKQSKKYRPRKEPWSYPL